MDEVGRIGSISECKGLCCEGGSSNSPWLVGLPGDGKKKHKVETEVSSLTAAIIDVVEVGISFHNNFSTGDV